MTELEGPERRDVDDLDENEPVEDEPDDDQHDEERIRPEDVDEVRIMPKRPQATAKQAMLAIMALIVVCFVIGFIAGRTL